MIELDRHIEILLLDNDCVIVPDFGGFTAHHVCARRDETDGMCLPPMRTIGFNPQLTLNDSLLAQSYVECYDISYPEAVKRIADEVRELKQHIENDGHYEFHDLGIITLNDEGHYLFEPCEAGILTPAYYGLSGYEMSTLSEELHVVDQQKHATLLSENPSSSQNVNILGDGDNSDRPIEATTKFISLWRSVAVACIAIILFLVIPTPLSNQHSLIQQSTIDTGLLQRIIEKTEQQLSKRETATPALPVKDTRAAQQKAVVPQKQERTINKNFTIVLASHVTKQNAENYVNDLHQRGYNKAEVLQHRQHIKVVYGHFASKEDANNTLRQLRNHQEFSEAWILKEKNELSAN